MIQVLTDNALTYKNFDTGKSWAIDDGWLHVYSSENKRLASFNAREVIFVQEKQD